MLSLALIVKNEEKNLARCLDSVKGLWDELVIVDTGSTDKTVEICKKYTDKIILRDFPGHIEQKNFAIDQAKNDWVLCVDADEEVSPKLQEEILQFLKHLFFFLQDFFLILNARLQTYIQSL